MSDRDMLLIAYGALRAMSTMGSTTSSVCNIIEDHLYPERSSAQYSVSGRVNPNYVEKHMSRYNNIAKPPSDGGDLE